MKIGFDLISDLNLSPEDSFNWENKATSLYCLVAGNISSDLRTILLTLNHLSKFYQGVFYTPGFLEFQGVGNYNKRINEITNICKKIRNVAFLHHHVVIIDGIAVLGCPGWYGNESNNTFEELHAMGRFEDLIYLKNSIEKLQKHLDVKKILIVTNAVPNKNLYFGETPESYETLPELSLVLSADSESKISNWAYGSYKKIVDTNVNGINYICNPSIDFKKNTYWAKRINIET
jgi:hypothetical protein